MADEEWQARMERCQELQAIQLERLQAEYDAASDFNEAKQEVGWARESVRRIESILSAARVEREARAAEIAAAHANVLSWQQQHVACEARLAKSEAREDRLDETCGDVASTLERMHLEDVADTRRRLESDADRVWGPGWRDR